MRTITYVFLLAACTACVVPQHFHATADKPEALPGRFSSALPLRQGFHYETLPNGLRLVVQENHTAPVAAVRIYVKTGSIYEQEYLGSGISHYFEHLISGGTTGSRTEKEIRETLDFLGGRSNAYTTKGHTAYYITTSADKVGKAIDLMSDWMKNSIFPEAEYKREKNVVLQELYKGREEPSRVFQKLFYETMFQTHPVRYPVIGFEEQVKKISRDDILQYYKRMYVPNNMVVVVVGDFRAAKVTETIKKSFGDFKRRSLPAISLPAESRQLGKRVRVVESRKVRGADFRLGFHTVAIDHPDLYALDVLSYVLSHGRSSRLVKRVVESQRLASKVFSYSNTPEYQAGVFAIGGKGPASKVEDAVQSILVELDRVKRELVTDGELKRAIRQKVANSILYNQTAADQASDLGINVLMTGNPDFNRLYLAGIRKVTADQVRDVAQRYLTEDNLSIVIMRPPAAAKAAADVMSQEQQPIRMVRLRNGLRVLLKRNPSVPVVSMQAYFLGGVRLEKGSEAGVSRMVGKLLTRGTSSRTGNEIAAVFDAMGGKINASAGNNTIGLNAEVLSEDFEAGLSAFSDVLLNPSFPASEFEKVREMSINALARYNDDWHQQVYRLFRKSYFGSHPYSNIALGTSSSLKSMTADKVRVFYKRHVVPSNGVLAVFGDIDEEKTLAAIRRHFGSMPAGEVELMSVKAQRAVDKLVSVNVDRGISAIMVGYAGTRFENVKDRFPLMVLDAVLDARLYEELRGKRDLVYLAYCSNFVGLDPGYFGIVSATTPAKMVQVQKIILDEVKKVREKPISDRELEKAKAICLNNEILANQTNSDMALQALLDELYGLGYRNAAVFKNRVGAVTQEEVQRVAKAYLSESLIVRTDGKVMSDKK